MNGNGNMQRRELGGSTECFLIENEGGSWVRGDDTTGGWDQTWGNLMRAGTARLHHRSLCDSLDARRRADESGGHRNSKPESGDWSRLVERNDSGAGRIQDRVIPRVDMPD
jgi:hypothetical protein